MIENSDTWKKRAAEILKKGAVADQAIASEATQFATSLLTAFYGSESTQLREFRAACEAISTQKVAPSTIAFYLCSHAHGAIQNAAAELDAGLIANLRVAIAGEVLAELVRLAKEIMADRNDGATNVSAVLIAAAYEDLIRKMGAEFGGVTDRPKLEQVIVALKIAGVLKGGQVGIAQSYLKFRNDSLHADWNNVDRSQVESCLAFVESLLLKHFS